MKNKLTLLIGILILGLLLLNSVCADLVYDNGNVGIGTDSPGNQLHVYAATGDATIEAEGVSAGDPTLLLTAAENRNSVITFADNAGMAGRILYDHSSNEMEFHTNGMSTVDMLIDANGNVGIGTTSPAKTLHVQGDAYIGSSTERIYIKDDGTSIALIGFDGSNYNDIHLRSVSGASTQLYLKTDGNVGIGTTSPVRPLEISGTTGTSLDTGQVFLRDTTAQAADVGSLLQFIGKFTDAGNYATGGGIKSVKDNGVSGNLGFGLALLTRDPSSGVKESVRILGNGNVGIGTTSPSSLLEISGTSEAITITDTTTDSGGETFPYTIGTINFDSKEGSFGGVGDTIAQIRARMSNEYAASEIAFYTNTNPTDVLTEQMVINKYGYVGIGTTSPGYTLDVAGDIGYSGTITDYSDIRLKENITELRTALDKINSMKPVSFQMKNDSSSKTQLGFIAQDVQEFFPSVISINSATGYLGLDYTQLIAPTIKAIQEQQQIISSQNQTINQIKKCLSNSGDFEEYKLCVEKI